jgi:hypothetical protein
MTNLAQLAFKALLAALTCAAISLATPSWAEGDAE